MRSYNFRDLACEVLSLRDRQYLQDQSDVFNMLQGIDGLADDLGFSYQDNDMVAKIIRDIVSKGAHFGVKTSSWHFGTTDIPWQLGEGTRSSLLDTYLLTNPVALSIEEQLLSRHLGDQNVLLVRDLIQCYHRADGICFSQN